MCVLGLFYYAVMVVNAASGEVKFDFPGKVCGQTQAGREWLLCFAHKAGYLRQGLFLGQRFDLLVGEALAADLAR